MPVGGCRSFYVVQLRTVVFSQRRMISFLFCLAVLPTLSAPRFPSFRPDIASFRSCLLLPPGFLRLAYAQEAVRDSPSISSSRLVLHVMHVPGGFRQLSRNISSSGAELRRFCNYVKLFFGLSLSQVSALFSTIYCGYTLARSKSIMSCCVEDLSPLWITIRRTSSRLFRCVVFVCAPMYFPFSHLHTLRHHIVP